jgi:hypothetical protein
MMKWIKGYEGLYQVSTKGEVISFKVSNKGRAMSPSIDKDGYLQIGLRDTGSKRRWYRVHRLVAETYIPNPSNLPMINHKDCDPSNNEVSNLEWCDRSHNNKYRFLMGYEHRGEKATTAKLTEEEVLAIYELAWEGDLTQKEIATLYKVSRGAISNIKYGATWSHITNHNKEE